MIRLPLFVWFAPLAPDPPLVDLRGDLPSHRMCTQWEVGFHSNIAVCFALWIYHSTLYNYKYVHLVKYVSVVHKSSRFRKLPYVFRIHQYSRGIRVRDITGLVDMHFLSTTKILPFYTNHAYKLIHITNMSSIRVSYTIPIRDRCSNDLK